MLAAVLAHLALMPTAGCISMSADVYPVATVRSPCFFPIVFHDLESEPVLFTTSLFPRFSLSNGSYNGYHARCGNTG